MRRGRSLRDKANNGGIKNHGDCGSGTRRLIKHSAAVLSPGLRENEIVAACAHSKAVDLN